MRRLQLTVLGVLAVALIALIAYWWWSVRALDAGLGAWVEARRAEGYQISMTRADSGGFPLAAALTIQDPAIAAPDGAWGWRAPALAVRTRPFDPYSLVLDVAGGHTIHFSGATEASQVDAQVEAGEITLSAGPDGRLVHIAAWLGPFRLEGDDLGVVNGQAAILTYAPDGGSAPMPRFDVAATLDGLVLPDDDKPALGTRIERFGFQAKVHGALPDQPLGRALALWRGAGGRVEIESSVLAWGPLHVRGLGALTLDPALQPHAELTTHVRGHRDALTAMAVSGAITPEDAALAKIALTLMEQSPADGSGPVAELPVSVRGRTVFAGPLALLTHSPIRWP